MGTNVSFGSLNSKIIVYGTQLSINTTDLFINDKILVLNINSTDPHNIDIGNLSGIQIYGYNDIGYIKTSSDAKRFIIKAPNDSNTNFISGVDLNNNL